MPQSLKQRTAAFQAAASQDTTPTKKKVGRTSTTSTPKKLSTNRINKMNVVTPDSIQKKKTIARPKPSKIQPAKIKVSAGSKTSPTKQAQSRPAPSKIKPAKINVTAGSTTTTARQGQSKQSDKAKAAIVAPSSKENQDWSYLYELALQFDQSKLQEAEETKNPTPSAVPAPKRHDQGDKKNIKSALEGVMGGNYTANGNFLTDEFFDKYLVENKKFKSLTFDFCGQNKLFKRFDRKDEEQNKICKMFVDALLKHPRSSDITALNMANSLLPDEFLEALADRCLENPKKNLPKLQALNLESNVLGHDGITAMSQAIANPQVWRRLQVLKLENQKMSLTSDAEEALGEAILQSPSLVVVSLQVRGGLERQQINNTVTANIDNLRQARRKHKVKTGTLQERKRNEMEQLFDKISANDSSITAVDIVGNIKFLGLNPTERTKTGAAFATNSHVKTIKMVKLQLDDAFAVALGKSLGANSTIEKILLDSNAISGTGMKALLEGLGKNGSVLEFQVRHQTKKTSSSDEEALPPLLADNKTLIKLGVDLRNQMAKMQLDRKTNENREYQRKQRAAERKK